MSYFHVYTERLHIDIVKAFDEEHAVKLVEIMYGPATKYNSTGQYKAVKA